MELNFAKKQLISNPAVAKGKRIGAEYQAWQDFIKSDKDGLFQNTPEYEQVKQEWQNYISYGDINGPEGGGGEFRFKNPGKTIDLEETFRITGGSLKHDGLEGYGDQYGSRQFVSENRKQQAALTLYNDTGINGVTLRKHINQLQENGVLGKEEADVIKYIRNRIDPYVPSDNLDKGFKSENESSRAGRGGLAQFADPYSAWMNGYVGGLDTNTANMMYLQGKNRDHQLVPISGLNIVGGLNDDRTLKFVNLPSTQNREYQIRYVGGTEYGDGKGNGGYTPGGRVGLKSLVSVSKEDLKKNPELLLDLGRAGLIEDTQWFTGWLWNEDEFLDVNEIKSRKSNEAWFSGEKGNTFNFVAYYPHDYNVQTQMKIANEYVQKGMVTERTGDTYGSKASYGVTKEKDGTFAIRTNTGELIKKGFNSAEEAENNM
jgi:hypothetical protein